jgi:hypothetical protein
MARSIKNPDTGSGGQNRLRPYEALYRLLVRMAEFRNRPVMTFRDFLFFVYALPECFYCGDAVKWAMFNPHGAAYNLDRWDNTKGYTRKNCVVCCGVCNRMKHCLSAKLFYKKIEQVFRRRVA